MLLFEASSYMFFASRVLLEIVLFFLLQPGIRCRLFTSFFNNLLYRGATNFNLFNNFLRTGFALTQDNYT